MLSTNTPILSIDCKKKERLGNLYRTGSCYTTEAINVFDHDYPSLSKEKVIPHGIYDLYQNKGYLSIGSCAETARLSSFGYLLYFIDKQLISTSFSLCITFFPRWSPISLRLPSYF